MKKDFTFFSSKQNKINISCYGYENLLNSPAIFLVHGFKGFKDWGFGPYLCDYFATKGYFVVAFNFSHNGVGDNLFEFDQLEKFAANTFSLEIEELSELVDAYQNNFFGEKLNKKIYLIGHSRGGAISLLTAKLKKEITALAVWASIANFDRYSERQKENWKKKGYFEVLNQRTKQVMKLNYTLLEDLLKNKDDLLNIENAVRNLNRPLLIAHARQDLAVKSEEAELLYEWSNKNLTEFYSIENAGHTFEIKHPFEGSNKKFDDLLSKTEFFFRNN